MVGAGPDHWRVRYLRTLREVFHVFVDGRGVLRTAHEVRFLGLTVLRLHYKLERDRSTTGSRGGPAEGGAAAVSDGTT